MPHDWVGEYGLHKKFFICRNCGGELFSETNPNPKPDTLLPPFVEHTKSLGGISCLNDRYACEDLQILSVQVT